MKFTLAASILLGLVSYITAPALAKQPHEGVVRQLRIDAGADAAICAAVVPNLPDGVWACFYENQTHYQEMKEMLFRTFGENRTCTFEWTEVDPLTDRARIDVFVCSP